jgi:hypothetical protein
MAAPKPAKVASAYRGANKGGHPAEICEFDMSMTGVLGHVDRLSPNFRLAQVTRSRRVSTVT